MPAANVPLLLVPIVASSKSPFAVVVRFPLVGAELLAVFVVAASKELDVATPEYSRMAKRNGPETLMDTVTVFAPLLMFSA